MIGLLSTLLGVLFLRLPEKHRLAFAIGFAIGSFSALPAKRLGPSSKNEFSLYQLGPIKLLLDKTNLIDKTVMRRGWENLQRAMLFYLAERARNVSNRKFIFLDVGAALGLV